MEEMSNIKSLRPTSAHKAIREAYEQRDLCKYLLSPAGEITWQYEHVHGGFNPDFLYE